MSTPSSFSCSPTLMRPKSSKSNGDGIRANKSTKSELTDSGIYCQDHMKEAVFICVEETCAKRILCSKCLSAELQHIEKHDQCLLSIQKYNEWVDISVTNTKENCEFIVDPIPTLIMPSHTVDTKSLDSSLKQAVSRVPETLGKNLKMLEQSAGYYKNLMYPISSLKIDHLVELVETLKKRNKYSSSSQKIDKLSVLNNVEGISKGIANSKETQFKLISSMASQFRERVHYTNGIYYIDRYQEYIKSIECADLLIDSETTWNIFSKPNMLVYFTNLIFSKEFINWENFNVIADKLRGLEVVGLVLNLDKVGFPEKFKPFIPKGCHFLTINLGKCGLLEEAVIGLHDYFMCLDPKQKETREIKRLEIDMKQNIVCSYNISKLVKSLKSFEELSELKLDFSGHLICSETITQLSSLVSHLKYLAVFNLNISKPYQVQSVDLTPLFSAFEKSLIKNLQISLLNYSMKPSKFNLYCQSISQMRNLENFTINLPVDEFVQQKLKCLRGLVEFSRVKGVYVGLNFEREVDDKGKTKQESMSELVEMIYDQERYPGKIFCIY